MQLGDGDWDPHKAAAGAGMAMAAMGGMLNTSLVYAV